MSDFIYRREYRGSLRAAVLDFSGTLIDAYVLAPATVFVAVLHKYGVEATPAEVRAPMGLRKDLHIKALLENEKIRMRWVAARGSEPTDRDVAALYADFIPLQLDCLASYCTPLPQVPDTLAHCRQDHGMKLAATTGFTRAMVDVIMEQVQAQLQLDATVGGDEVHHGSRPRPFMLYRALDLMDVSPIAAVVKVDDSSVGIEEGLEAGCWTVGVSRYSSYMDITSLEQASGMSPVALAARNSAAADILRRAGAHYVVDSVADLPYVVQDINQRLVRGERP